MKNILDDQARVSRLDPSGMINALDNSARMLLDPLVRPTKIKYEKKPRIDNLVFTGMGGSALTADVMVDWLGDRLKIPVSVVREEKLPGFVDENTLVVSLSYSGETLETLGAFERARARKSMIVGIGSGGRLWRLCDRYNYPFFMIRPTVAPRAALYQMVAAASMVVEAHGLGTRLAVEVDISSRELSHIHRGLSLEVGTSSNRAKKMAGVLLGKVPVVYALSRMASVARRFKNQINENSKQQARFDLLPEAGHNDVEAWQEHRGDRLELFVPIIIRDVEESRWESRFLDAYQQTISGVSSPVEVRVRTHSRLGRLLGPTFFLDYVSVYLAYLRGVDPTMTSMIKQFRKRSSR